MVALKNAEIESFISRPDPRRPSALVFGPDAGLVRERVDALVKAAVDDPTDPFALARLDGDALADEPGRLFEEAHTFPLFGGRRAVDDVQSRNNNNDRDRQADGQRSRSRVLRAGPGRDREQ